MALLITLHAHVVVNYYRCFDCRTVTDVLTVGPLRMFWLLNRYRCFDRWGLTDILTVEPLSTFWLSNHYQRFFSFLLHYIYHTSFLIWDYPSKNKNYSLPFYFVMFLNLSKYPLVCWFFVGLSAARPTKVILSWGWQDISRTVCIPTRGWSHKMS